MIIIQIEKVKTKWKIILTWCSRIPQDDGIVEIMLDVFDNDAVWSSIVALIPDPFHQDAAAVVSNRLSFWSFVEYDEGHQFEGG